MTEILPGYTRVSEFLSMIPTLSTDGKWGFPMQQIDEGVLERKRELGSSVHAAIKAHIDKEFYPSSDKEQGYLDSFIKWQETVDLTCHETERRFYYEPMKITGCVDMLAKLNPNGIFHLIDFKCTVNQDKVKWPIQAAFYHFLAEVNGIKLDKSCFFVQLDPNGDYPKVWEYVITKELTSVALSLYNVYKHLTSC